MEYVIEGLVGRHTITVEFLAHLAHTKLWTVKRLKEELEQKGFQLTFHKDGEFVNIQESYEVLYDLSGLTGAEQNVLEAFSVFPYIPLAAEICNEWLLADAGVNEDDDTLMGLYQKGWLQLDLEQESYTLHPVFAQFIYEKRKPLIENHWGLIKSCQKSLKIPESGLAFECLRYIPFAENILEKIDMKERIEEAQFIAALANLLQYIAEYAKAEVLYEKSLRIRESVLGEEHPDTIINYNNLAALYYRQGEYKKAEELYERSLRIRESVLGKEHLDTATSYNSLAVVFFKQKKYVLALAYYMKVYRIFINKLGLGHPNTKIFRQHMEKIYAEWNAEGNFGQWLEEQMKK